MRGKTIAALRLEHLVGEPPLLRHRPVRLDVFLLDVDVRCGSLELTVARGFDEAEAVHRAVLPCGEESGIAVRYIFDVAERNCFERDRLFDVPSALFHQLITGFARNGAFETREEVVERAVLLNDEHHVLNGRAARARMPVPERKLRSSGHRDRLRSARSLSNGARGQRDACDDAGCAGAQRTPAHVVAAAATFWAMAATS